MIEVFYEVLYHGVQVGRTFIYIVEELSSTFK